uniref:protein-serine/threonine phosphatase n=1 Tax=Ananas comosus var. bracteatus TaxID=296719 RepID=A0A6V7NR96_ANACO|nr:unnamed protein product [Ananas comosus var. bracteatus]
MALGGVLLKKIKVRRFATRGIKDKEPLKNNRWIGISHGFYSVERDGNSEGSVLAQREQIEGLELWLFGAFDQQIGGGITKYLQSHLFQKNLNEIQIRRKAKEIMRKAYINSRANVHKGEGANEVAGSTTLLVMNDKKFIAADFGGYKVVVCKDGVATQISQRNKKKKGRSFISGLLQLKCVTNSEEHKPRKKSRLAITAQNVESDTNFIILASDGVWEVMRYQEAVDLIGHIEDAQKAAECLAAEALTRMSKATISCIVVRFH